MINFITQLRIKMIPTMARWADLGFVEIEHPDDFFHVGYKGPLCDLPEVRGIICPIPDHVVPSPYYLSQYYNAVRNHPQFQPDKKCEGDTTSRLIIQRGLNDSDERMLPPELLAIENMLSDAFEATIGAAPISTIYQINSNHHRVPETHSPTAIATLDGPTAIMFAEKADGTLIGKKSLPTNSIVVLLGSHAAPDTRLRRFNIIDS